MKNKLLNFFLAFIMIFAFALSAEARISSQSDVYAKANTVKKIAEYDYSTLIGKTELIGYRANSFDFAASQFKNTAWQVYEILKSIAEQIDVINNSIEYSDSDKQLQINKLYQEADTVLYDLDSKTITYVYSLRTILPSVSFSRYSKKFLDFYNSQKVTDNEIVVK